MILRSTVILIFLLGACPTAFSQFGVSTFYSSISDRQQEELPEFFPQESIYNLATVEFAINYWFRLPTKRIEFQPTLYYLEDNNNISDLNELGFQLKTNFYLFDFGTDCNCPTFGKQGPQLQKGFFLQLSPGVSRHSVTVDRVDLQEENYSFTLGGGLGIDFGVSNLLTLTPIAGVRYTVNQLDYISVDDGGSGVFLDTRGLNLLTYQLGLQATFRLDKRRY